MSSAKKKRELNRAKTEHDTAKLSAQFALANHAMLNIAESLAATQIETLTRQRDELLAELEAAASYHASHECYAEANRVRKFIASVKEKP